MKASGHAVLNPDKLDFESALTFFHAYMFGPVQGKLRLYRARNIPTGQMVIPSDWEVFGSMLVRDPRRREGSGVDLLNFEVKSAKSGSAYEYQYHKITGKDLLIRDATVGHLFFDHKNFLREVNLRYIHGSALEGFFEKWLSEYPDPYPQRYRKNIPFGYVAQHGLLLMTLKDGEVVYPQSVSTTDPGTE